MSFKDASGKTISDRGKYLTVWKEQADNHSESYFYSFSRTDLSALPRRRTVRGIAGHKLVGHAEQILQHIGIDAREANEHRVKAGVVVRHVVNIGVRSEQLSAIIEIHAKDKRTGFGGAISRDTRQEFPMDLECREPIRCALLNAGQSKSDIPYGVEVDCASGHRSERFLRTHCSSLARYRQRICSADDVAVIIPKSRNPFKDKS